MKWLLAAVLLLLVGAFMRLGLLVYAMYVLLGVLLVSRWLARQWTENLSATRTCSVTEANIGESAEVAVTIRNEGALPVGWLLVEDSLPREALVENPPRLRAEGARLGVVQLAPHGEHELRYQVHFLMRGYYQLGPLLLESGDLFGLHRRYRVATEPAFVMVLPKIIPLRGYNLASRLPVGEVRMTHRLFEDPTRITGVRLYERGDPLNRVHWRATARTGTLHCKTYEPSCVAGATLLLDFHTDNHQGNGRLYRSELAVTTVASLANAVQQLGQQVGFVTNGRDAVDRIHHEGWRPEFHTRAAAQTQTGMRARSDRLQPVVIETRRGPEQLRRILEALARVELTDGLSLPQLIKETGSRLPRNATIVAVLAAAPAETAIALGSLRRSGYAVTAVLVTFNDPQHSDWAVKPEWIARLLAEGLDVRTVEDEEELARLCSEQLTR